MENNTSLVIVGYSQEEVCHHCGRKLLHGIRLDDGRIVGAQCFDKALTLPLVYNGKKYRIGAENIIKYGYGELVRIMYSDREIYPDDKNSTLDFTSEFNITCKGHKVEMIETNRVLVLDIKSKVNIWPFEFYETIDKDILNEFEEHEQIRRLL
jgi:hypothetical protein